MVIKIPREKIKKIDIVNIQGGLTATQVYKKYKPDYMINLALYDMASGTNITHLKDEGVASGYLFSNEGIGIKGDAEIIWTTKDDNSVRDYVSGSPVLLKNGQKHLDWGNKKSDYICGSHNRSAIGFNSQEMMLYTSNEELTLNELQDALIWHGFDYAINCDGGGSCHLQEGEKIYTKSVRSNASWLLIYGMEVKNMPIVCLDAGHGKDTAGKRSPDGTLLEYEFNRDVTSRIKTILEQHDVEVVLTCYDNEDKSLAERCKIANKVKANYFVSIHANAHDTSVQDEEGTMHLTFNSASGWEIYVISKGGKAEQLAKKIHKHSQELGLKDRGIKAGNFQVLRDTDMPAVLIEHGFYTNKEECEKLKSDSFRQRCAEADAKGILEQLGIEYKGKDINVATKNEVADTNVGELVLKIGQKTYTVNGQKKELEVAPMIINGRTLTTVAPLRDLGLTVEWNGEEQTITIRKDD